MYRFPRFLLAFLVVCLSALMYGQTTTLSAQASNNTAACAAAGSPSYCQAGFNGMSDSTGNVYNAAPGHISSMSLRSALYSGNNTDVFAYLMPWFCMNPGSSNTGPGFLCGQHIQVGYNSNDAATVNGQLTDLASGTHILYVQAVGKAGILVDHLSNAVKYVK